MAKQKFEVIKAWAGVSLGDVIDLDPEKIHPAIKSNIRPVVKVTKATGNAAEAKAAAVKLLDDAKAAAKLLDDAKAAAKVVTDEADKVLADARTEAERIVTEAYAEAEKIVTEAYAEAEKIKEAASVKK